VEAGNRTQLDWPLEVSMRVFILTLLIALIPAVEVRSQGDAKNNALLSPRSNLITVHWPDLSKLEVDVREYLLTSQATLAAAVKNASATDSALGEAYGVTGQTFHAYSLNSTARECYVNASRLGPKDFRWVYLIAKLDQLEGHVDEAIKGYLLVQKLNPGYVAAAVNLGNTYLEMNRLADARENFSAVLNIEKNNAAALYGLGQVALSERKYAEAARYFERTLAIIPAATRIHYSLAMAYRGLGDMQKAKANLALQGSVGVRPVDPLIDELQEFVKGERLHLVRGRLALEALRYAEAASEFRKAIAVKPDSVTGRVNLGAVLGLVGDVPGAIQQFEEVLRIAPENPNAHYNLGLLFAGEKRHEEAISHLLSVLKSNPQDSDARVLLAQEYMRSDRRGEALQEYSRVVQGDPNNEKALLEYVKLLLDNKRYTEALNSLEKSHTEFPNKKQTAAMLATLLATSPVFEQRNGARALDLAREIYYSTNLIEHGEIVSMALAELGLCVTARDWQKKLIDVAQREEKTDLVVRLKRDLQVYESPQCRPPR
jgi:tetratricopeptide (TPR) repeat protein